MQTNNRKFINVGDNQKFYYNEVLLVNGQKKINVIKAKANLTIFHSILTKAKIRYGLFFGTLLGAIREGNFILHDEDTDIYILDEDRDQFHNLLEEFKSKGLNLVRAEENLYSLMKDDEYIDIYFFRAKFKFGVYKLRVLNNHFEYPAMNLEQPIKFQFLDLDINIPKHPEQILKKIYGSNWRTPIQNHPAPPNTFYKKVSNMAQLVKNVPGFSKAMLVTKLVLRKFGL